MLCPVIKNNFKKIKKYYFNIFMSENTLKNNHSYILKYNLYLFYKLSSDLSNIKFIIF
jgi:hypothetical protein